MAIQKINSVKGMNDILPEDSHSWLWLEEQLRKWLFSYGYENIRTPIVEGTKLFTRSIGDATDIVEKEMYTFTDKLNDDSLTLRPEGTAGVLRSVIQHELLYNKTQKLWYIGPMFRHERPQKGRYRQFHQLGVEALGFKDPDIDSEIILMLRDLWQRLGIKNLQLHINCLGNLEERATHRAKLIKYFEQNINLLDEDATKRLYKNPLRILDTKNPAMQELVTNAPMLIDYLGSNSLEHYTLWKSYLTNLGIEFIENPRLVRGLDYYNLSVFEWVSSNLGAQGTVAAGGRYDSLVKELSGKDNYAIGFAIGLERILLELEALNITPNRAFPDVFIATSGSETQVFAFEIAGIIRDAGLSVVQNFGLNSFKSQLKKADGLKCKFTVIVGETEVSNNQVMVKSMDRQTQESVAVEDLLNFLHKHKYRLEK